MLKEILQGCILILINQHHYYGYTISQELLKYGFIDIPKNYFQRKYYYITSTGKQA